VVLVFFDKYDYMTLRLDSVVFIDNVRVGMSRALGLQRYEFCRYYCYYSTI
jgi:hypothetical protein